MLSSRAVVLSLSAGCLLPLSAAHAQLRVVAWNITNYSGGRTADLHTSVYGLYQGRSMSPDVMAIQEVSSASALSQLVGILNTAPGSPGDWAAAPFIDGPDSESVLVYRTSKAQLIATVVVALGSSDGENQPRNTYRYDIRPVGYNAPAATVGIYNVHLKAGSASSDNARRLIETTRIRDNAAGINTNGPNTALPAGYAFMIAGDFNVQSSGQSAYQQLVGELSMPSSRFFDPINTPGSWNNNSAFRFVHTQDPVGSGGMDDRHDQILVSGSLIDGNGFDYIGNASIAYSTSTWNDPNHSYRVWGNDGTSFDQELRTTGNTMVGPAIAQSLKTMAENGGHLPVFIDMRVPAKIQATQTIDFGDVTQGAFAFQSLTVTHAGNTALWTAQGLDTLRYSFGAIGDVQISTSPSTLAPGASFPHFVILNTDTVGPKSAVITITTNDPDRPTVDVTVTGRVVAANTAPTADAGPDLITTDLGFDSVETVTLDGSASSDSDGTIIEYRWLANGEVLAVGPDPTATAAFPLGSTTVTLRVTDNGGLTDEGELVVTVNPGCPADWDNSGGIDGDDIAAFFADWQAGLADPDYSGGTDGDDITVFFAAWEAGGC